MTTEALHLSPEYYQGITYEALKESLTNEIAHYVTRVQELGLDSPESEPYLKIISHLENIRDELRVEDRVSLEIAANALQSVKTVRELRI